MIHVDISGQFGLPPTARNMSQLLTWGLAPEAPFPLVDWQNRFRVNPNPISKPSPKHREGFCWYKCSVSHVNSRVLREGHTPPLLETWPGFGFGFGRIVLLFGVTIDHSPLKAVSVSIQLRNTYHTNRIATYELGALLKYELIPYNILKPLYYIYRRLADSVEVLASGSRLHISRSGSLVLNLPA